MTLKDLYLKAKKKTLTGSRKPFRFSIWPFLRNLGSIALFVWIIQVLWNTTAQLWKQPELGFLQTASVLFLIILMKVLLTGIEKGTTNQNQICKGVKENNAECKQSN